MEDCLDNSRRIILETQGEAWISKNFENGWGFNTSEQPMLIFETWDEGREVLVDVGIIISDKMMPLVNTAGHVLLYKNNKNVNKLLDCPTTRCGGKKCRKSAAMDGIHCISCFGEIDRFDDDRMDITSLSAEHFVNIKKFIVTSRFPHDIRMSCITDDGIRIIHKVKVKAGDECFLLEKL